MSALLPKLPDLTWAQSLTSSMGEKVEHLFEGWQGILRSISGDLCTVERQHGSPRPWLKDGEPWVEEVPCLDIRPYQPPVEDWETEHPLIHTVNVETKSMFFRDQHVQRLSQQLTEYLSQARSPLNFSTFSDVRGDLSAAYALVAAYHDADPSMQSCRLVDRTQFPKFEEFVFCCKSHVDNGKADDGKAHLLRTALDWVRKDLAEAPALTDALLRLLSVYTKGLAEEKWKIAAAVIVDENLSVDEQLWKIHGIMPIPPTTSARQLGEMLKVSGAAVKKTPWWDEIRRGEKKSEIDRRLDSHRCRAGQSEPDSKSDG